MNMDIDENINSEKLPRGELISRRNEALVEFRRYLRENNPPVLDDLISRVKSLITYNFFKVDDLVRIVNKDIHPFELIVEESSSPIVTDVNQLVRNPRIVSNKTERTVSNSLVLQPQNYYPKDGTVIVPGYEKIMITKRGKTRKENGKENMQCRMMRMVFKNVNTMENGVSYSLILSVNSSKIDDKYKARMKNHIDEINRKLTDILGYKKIIKKKNNKVFVNKSYL